MVLIICILRRFILYEFTFSFECDTIKQISTATILRRQVMTIRMIDYYVKHLPFDARQEI